MTGQFEIAGRGDARDFADMKQRVLFVGIHNDARSQIAEAFLNAAFPARFEAYSVGLQPAPINPLAIEAMHEVGFDISNNKATSALDVIQRGEHFDFVITVCDEASGERCPAFHGRPMRLHWGFADPSAYEGSRNEKLAFMRHIRDEIKDQIAQWCQEHRNGSWNTLDSVAARASAGGTEHANIAPVAGHV